jgi:hypothetical protein
MISKQRIGQQFLLIVSLLTALVISVLGCTNSPQQTTGLKTSTKPPSQTTGTSTSTITQTSPTILPTREIWPVNLPPDMMGRISEMLMLIPDNPEVSHEQVWFIDFAAWDFTLNLNKNDYRNTSGQQSIGNENNYINDLILSSMDTDDRVRPTWYPWLGQPPFISGMGLDWKHSNSIREIIKYSPIRTENVGYGPLDVQSSILSSAIYKNSPFDYETIKANFSTSTIKHTVEQYQEGYQCPQVSDSNGISIYSWDGEVDQSRELFPPIFDNNGKGRTLAVQSGYIFCSQQPMRVDEMIEASQGRIPNLGDDPLYQELANKLEAMGNMSAVISVDKILKQDNWPGKSSFFEKAASYALLMGPYNAFAAGLSVDDKGMFVSLILLYESPDLAEKDIEVLKERLAAGTNSMNSPWAKEVDDSEVWADGNALCAKLYGNVTSYWDCFVHQEPLLVRGN